MRTHVYTLCYTCTQGLSVHVRTRDHDLGATVIALFFILRSVPTPFYHCVQVENRVDIREGLGVKRLTPDGQPLGCSGEGLHFYQGGTIHGIWVVYCVLYCTFYYTCIIHRVFYHFWGARPRARSRHIRAMLVRAVDRQPLLGDDDDKEARHAAMLEQVNDIVARLGDTGISKPKDALLFVVNLQYKKVGGQQLECQCMFCNKLISSTGATRVVDHLIVCILCPDAVKQSYAEVFESVGYDDLDEINLLLFTVTQ